MQKIRTLIVDDEPYNREELRYLLGNYASIEVVGEADSGDSCILQATKLQPDLIFLDIEMPGMDGMKAAELLGQLKKRPLVVFATAYPEFAVQAFRLEAIDYLLKPYDEEQLNQTIERIEKRLLDVSGIKEQSSINRLAIGNEGEFFYLEPSEVLYFQSEDKHVKIITKTNEYHSKGTLKELESRLANFPFFRIHKSYLVNLDHVSKLTPWFNGAYNLILKDREESLPVSRNNVKALREKLEL